MIKKNYLKLFKGILEATYKGVSEVYKTSKIYTFGYTFLESIYDQLQSYNAEERSGIIEFIQSSTNEDISKMLEDIGEYQCEIKTLLPDLVKILGYSTAQLENVERHIKGLEKKTQLFETMLSLLNDRSSELTCDRAILIELLNEILKYTKTDPSSYIFIPPSLKSKDKPTIRELLYYSSQWTPLVGRKIEEEELEKFAESDKPFIWWGIQGPGGSGKSRLALEWILKLSKKGWKAGFIAGENLKKFIDTEDWRPLRPTAIVVDYGHEKSEIIPKFVEKYYRQIQNLKFPPLRLLVLDRASSSESWWMTSLQLASEKDQICLASTCYKTIEKSQKGLIINKERTPDILELKPIESEDFQTEIIRNVIIKCKNDDKTTVIPSLKEIADLANHFADGRPLYLSMLGIAIAEKGKENLQGWNYEILLDHIIKREIDIWKNFTGLGENIDTFISDVAFITLCNGLSVTDFENFLPQYPRILTRSKKYKDKLINLLGMVNDEKIQPLAPDILGGRFLLSGGAPSDNVKYFDCSSWIVEALKTSPNGLGQTILRTSQDFDSLNIVSKWLDIALDKLPDDFDDKIYIGFLLTVSILILIFVMRGHRLEDKEWIEKYMSLAIKNEISTKHILLLMISIFNVLDSEKRWFELEYWTGFLSQIHSNPLFKDDKEIGLLQLGAIVNLIDYYGSVKKWDKFEDWYKKLKTIRRNPLFENDREFVLYEALANVNAMKVFGSENKWIDLEELGTRIIDIRHNPLFKNDRDLALAEAMAGLNAINQYGLVQKWIELEKWGKRIKEIRRNPLFKVDEMIAFTEAKASFNAICSYGSSQKWDELEKWGERLREIRLNPMFKDDRNIAFEEANSTFNVIAYYGSAHKWIELEEWGERIKAIRLNPLFKEDLEFALIEVRGAFNAITTYGSLQKWIELEEWGEKIRKIRLNPLFKDDREIALAEARSSVNATKHYGSAQKWDKLELWVDRIRTIRHNPLFKNDREFAFHEAMAYVNAISHYGLAQKWIELEAFGEKIKAIRLNPFFKDDSEIALAEAKATFNAICHYSFAQKWDKLEEWGERIRAIRLNPLFKDDLEIAREEVIGTVHAIGHYGSAQKWDKLEEWGERIRVIRLNPLFIDDLEIAREEVMGAFNAITAYGSLQKWIELEEWGNMIKDIRFNPLFKDDRNIALAEAKAVVNIISFYGAAQKWTELERWGERIKAFRLNALFKNDHEIALAEAMAYRNAINNYSLAKKWIEVEKWAKRIKDMGLDPLFKDDREIALHEAKVAVDVILRYGLAKKWVALEKWGERLREIRLNPLFKNDKDIALEEVKGAVNAIYHYSAANNWIALEKWGKRIRYIRLNPMFKNNKDIALEEAKGSVYATYHYSLANKWIGNKKWINKIINLKEDFKHDYKILFQCHIAISRIFKVNPSEYIGAILLDITESAPWLKQKNELHPIGILNTQLLKNSNVISETTKKRALQLFKSFSEFLKTIPSEPSYSKDVLRKLWMKRRFMPYWGKNLWKPLLKANESELIRDALNDPWNSPEDKEQLENLLKKHIDNKE